MCPHRSDVLLEQGAAARGLLADGGDRNRFRIEEGLERRLGVDRDRRAAGKMHEHVRSPGSRVGRDRRLLIEVDAREQTRRLDDPAQLRFAPHSAGDVGPQRPGERLRRGAQLLVDLLRAAQLLAHLPELFGAFTLHLVDPLLHPVQRFTDRGERLQHRVLTALAFDLFVALRTIALQRFRRSPLLAFERGAQLACLGGRARRLGLSR